MFVRTTLSKYLRPVAIFLTLPIAVIVLIGVACDGDGDGRLNWPRNLEPSSADIVLSTVRTSWHIAAEPYQLEDRGYAHCKLLWHTPRELRTYGDIWDGESAPGEGVVRTLRFILRPAYGAWKSWGGVATCFDKEISDTIDYFDVRIHGDHGLIHIDFGTINEDLDDDGFADSEDDNGNGVVDMEEDVGLDGIADGWGETSSLWGTTDDPAGDDWYFMGDGKCPLGDGCDTVDWDSDEWYFEYLNGTEGNRYDPSTMGRPDSECLCSSPGFTKSDICFSWIINLTSDDFIVEGSEYNGWRTYRLPLRSGAAVDIVSETGQVPSWYGVKHIRFWLESDEGQTVPDTIEIADWRFVPAEE